MVTRFDLGPVGIATYAPDAEHDWEINFPPMPAGDASFTLEFGGQPVESLASAVFGDVFLFSGQSNIDISASYAHQFSAADERAEEAFAEQVKVFRTHLHLHPPSPNTQHVSHTPPAPLGRTWPSLRRQASGRVMALV